MPTSAVSRKKTARREKCTEVGPRAPAKRTTPRSDEELARVKMRVREARAALREKEEAEGLLPKARPSISNRISPYATVEEERRERQEVTDAHLRLIANQLPYALKRLGSIKDPRNPKSIKHTMAHLLVMGAMMFVYQMTSRRDANRRMTKTMFMENLRLYFPECTEPAHQDTLGRVLAKIDVEEIPAAHLELVRRLIRKKKFTRYLIDGCYPVAIDGTQKMIRDVQLGKQWQTKRVGAVNEETGEKAERYVVYVVEASLTFHNGMTIPLMTEFLDAARDDQTHDKQDCEQRAFTLMATRMKKEFPRLRFMLLLDGLYPNGPILKICRDNHWQYMIVLQDGSLPSVWAEFTGLCKLDASRHTLTWGNRRQSFTWVNEIDYRYGPNERLRLTLNMVTCEEHWEEIDPTSGKRVSKHAKHAWLSSIPLDKRNLHERCNLAARHRWGIETGFLVEKHQGYQYEHCFSNNWSAMKGYHYLMRLGHLLNTLALYSTALARIVRVLGYRGVFAFIWETMASPWGLDALTHKVGGGDHFQLRLE
jgi:hypothetical protein